MLPEKRRERLIPMLTPPLPLLVERTNKINKTNSTTMTKARRILEPKSGRQHTDSEIRKNTPYAWKGQQRDKASGKPNSTCLRFKLLKEKRGGGAASTPTTIIVTIYVGESISLTLEMPPQMIMASRLYRSRKNMPRALQIVV